MSGSLPTIRARPERAYTMEGAGELEEAARDGDDEDSSGGIRGIRRSSAGLLRSNWLCDENKEVYREIQTLQYK